MKILVTGAAGFIGFHLVEALLKEGNEIVGIDNINDYYDINLKYARLEKSGIRRIDIEKTKSTEGETNYVKSLIHDNYFFLKLDITDLLNLEGLFKREKFTHIVNLAAQAGVRYSIENPHAYIKSNILGFMNILECCRNYEIEHLLYASSSSVYGANTKVPFSEDDNVDRPVSLYAATKKSNELMAYTYSHLYNLPTTGLRFFTVYGPWGRPDMAPMLFANAITKNEPIKVFNNGEMQRDFTYVDDIVEGILRCIVNIPAKSPRVDVFNIGNSKPVDLMEFIATMEMHLDKKSEKIFMPIQPGDVKVTYADTSKLQKITGYNPKTTLTDGVKFFVKWFNDFYL
jgi:UDP-glucuronate 4-epimerase